MACCLMAPPITTQYPVPHASFTKISLEITHLKFYFNLPGASELSQLG